MNSFDQWNKRQLEDAPHRAKELMRQQQLDAANRARLAELEPAQEGEHAAPGQQPAPRRRPWWRFW